MIVLIDFQAVLLFYYYIRPLALMVSIGDALIEENKHRKMKKIRKTNY